MLKELVQTLCKELEVQFGEEEPFVFRLNDAIEIVFTDLKPGASYMAKIAPCPTRKLEDLFIYLMRANLLGQGTGGCRIGLDPSEKFLTLSLGFPYEMNYPAFKETVEDFANYLVYWREEIENFTKES